MKIRRYRAADRDAVRRICCETGQLGEPIDPHFSDRELFADVITLWYTDYSPDHSFVVDAGDGTVVGYLTGCLDTREHHRVVEKEIAPRLALKALARAVPLRPGTARMSWTFIADVLRDRPKFGYLDDDHPAHLHINLLPEARGRGLGRKLIEMYIDDLRAENIKGCFLETTVENTNAVGFFKAVGFEPVSSSPSPGRRGVNGERLHTLLMARSVD